MGHPQIRGIGSFSSGTSSTPGAPSGTTAGDLLIGVLEGSQSATAAMASTEASSAPWVKIFEESQGNGATGVTTLALWAWLFTSGYDANFYDPTAMNHIEGQVIGIYDHGVTDVATDIIVGTGAGKSSGTSCVIPGITVTADSLVLGCFAVTDDANDTDNITAFTNSNLASITEQFDQGVNTGGGGGIACFSALLNPLLVEQADSTGGSQPLAVSTATNYRMGQSFQVASAVPVGSVAVLLDASTGTPTDGIIGEIQTDSGGNPSGTVLASGTLASPTASQWNTITFTASASLSASTTYWLVLRRTGDPDYDSNNQFRWERAGSNAYANGSPKRYGSGAWANYAVDPTFDMAFRIYASNTVTGDSTATHDNTTQARFVHIGIPPLISGTNANVTPAAVIGTATVPTASVSAQRSASVTPSAVIGTSFVINPTKSAGASTTPAAVVALTQVNTATTSAGASVTPAAVVATAVVPTAVVSAVQNASITPNAVPAIATVQAPAVVGNANAPPNAVAATATVPTAIVTVAGDAAVTPSAVVATATVPTATVSAGTDAAVTFLDAPTGLVAHAISPTRIDLSWNTVAGATKYIIQRDEVVIEAANPDTDYSDTTVSPNTRYVYSVKGVP